ncbi:MAG: UDP-glucose dehydrogenase family protein [Wolinella sp.]
MRIAVIGTGYVGLVSGACFAEMGNRVTCVDVNIEKIDALKRGLIPIYEPGLEEMVLGNHRKDSLRFSTNLKEALSDAELAFIAVGTPMGEDGSADLQYVLAVAREIGACMTRYLVVVDKSTVPVGTARLVRNEILSVQKRLGVEIEFDVVSNPEFLKEGDAIKDFLKPDRVVVGSDSPRAMEIMRELYAPFTHSRDRFIGMGIESAEMTKYAANAMLATKISFMNEIANICEIVGADVNDVRKGIGSDSRIGYSFIYPGCGYGGSCFPKDVKALEKIALNAGISPKIISAVEAVNSDQKRVLARKIFTRFGENLKGKKFGIWGLSFKPETDDMREASSIVLISELLEHGASVQVYDPKAMEEAQKHYLKHHTGIFYAKSKYDALDGADAMILVTEWKEFRSPDFDEIKARLARAIIFDGRNQYKRERMAELGIEYHQIGVASIQKI